MKLFEIQNEQFRNLLEEFLYFLKKKSYKDSVLVNYRRTLAKIDIYMRENNIGEYSPKVGTGYYEHYMKHTAKNTRYTAIEYMIQLKTCCRFCSRMSIICCCLSNISVFTDKSSISDDFSR